MKNKAFRALTASTVIIAVINLAASIIYILTMPDKIPLHYNAKGICDGYGSKWFLLIFPLMLLIVFPIGLYATSKSKNIEKNMKPMTICLIFIEAYLVFMNWLILTSLNTESGLGDKMSVNISLVIPIVLSIMFIIMGNYMPTIRQNKNLGIKLPWTLKNERCWDVTHRFAGKVWVAVGIITLLIVTVLALARPTDEPWLYIALTIIPFTFAVIIPTVYAYQHRND